MDIPILGMAYSQPLIKGAVIPIVCIDCRYISDRPSGISEVVQGLVDHAPKLAPDLQFRLLRHPRRTMPLSAADNVTEHVVPVGPNSPATMWFLPEFAPLSGCDIFHATANILPSRLNMRTVTTIHDIMWLTSPKLCDPSAYGHVKRWFYAHGIRRALNQSDKIAAISKATSDEIASFSSCTKDRTTVTRSGVSDRFEPAVRDDAVLACLGVAAGTKYALIVGQHAPYKNHEGALRAFAKAFAAEADAKLVFVQRQGPSSAPLVRLASELGIGARVIFAGNVDNDSLLQLYSNAALLLHPSLCEGFGNPIAEAMACGCPVITSNISAMPEAAGGAAKLIDPSDAQSIAAALLEVWHDPAQALAMRDAGIAHAAELRWADFARANVAIYWSLLAAV